MPDQRLNQQIAHYWDTHIHDLAIATDPVGSPGFFKQLDGYRFEKLHYLPRVVDFGSFAGKKFLEIGCGAGIDLVRFAQQGALVTGVDLSRQAVSLAQKNFEQHGLKADLAVMDGESLEFEDNSFDAVYAHGVLQYTADPQKMLSEIHRILKPGGNGIFMVYNKYSWLNLMRFAAKVPLEHEDAPVLRKFSIGEFKHMLQPFQTVRIVVERFPVKSRLHKGLKGVLYNTFFVGTFNALPKFLVQPWGWHIMALVKK